MSENLTFKNPQLPLKKSFSNPGVENSGCPYRSDLINLGFSRFPQLGLYPHIAPLGRILTLSVFSPLMLNPLISLSPQGFDLSNLGLSRCSQLSLCPPITAIEILPFSLVLAVMPEPSISLSPCRSNMSNSCLSRLPQLSLYPPSASLGEILTLSLVSPVFPDPLTYLSLSLSGLRSTKNLNLVNRIEQIGQLAPVSAFESTPSNFMP
uniref:Uncharacterized protein n=1 Tax=Solanum tuberosum TaxID=4113 RepID=M1DFK6_SOLTU